jgi:hypothetical protein
MINELIIALISLAGGGLITFLITKHFKEKKSLAYQIVSKISLIDVKPEVREKIKIDYDGKPAENIFSFKVRVINDGNVPIKDQPILFEFDKETKVLVADYNTKPKREFGEIKRVNESGVTNEAKFVIGLLNPKRTNEQIEFNFITVDNKTDVVEIIAKGENLIFHEVTQSGSRFLRIFTLVWGVLTVITLSIVFIRDVTRDLGLLGAFYGIPAAMFVIYIILGWKISAFRIKLKKSRD